MEIIILCTLGFLVALAVLVALRVKTGGKIEIKNSDIVLPLVIIALVLFLTGKIEEFGFGDFRIVAAIEEASNTPVKNQVSELSQLPVRDIAAAPKRGIEMIPQLIERKTQALTFQMGHGGYYGPAIEEYFTRLSRYPYLQYVIINNRDGTLYGLADARQLTTLVERREVSWDYSDLADWLNRAETPPLQELPGFIPADHAVKQTSDVLRTLARMDSLNVHMLPAVDNNYRFAGVVERSKLTASMLVDIANRLTPNRP